MEIANKINRMTMSGLSHLTVEQLKSEMEVYSDIIKIRHAKGLEAKLEKRFLVKLCNELCDRPESKPNFGK